MHMHHQHHHPGGDLPDDVPGDSAHQSLADALRVSFKALTFIMIVVVILYCFSGVTTLEQHEKALVLRLGALRDIKGPGGWVLALPAPIDQIIKVPVAEKQTLEIHTHDLALKTLEDGSLEDRSKVQRAGGLDPAKDGSLMTADKGLVHSIWVVTYEIQDLDKLVRNVFGSDHSEHGMLTHAVENAAVEVIARMPSIDVTGEQLLDIQLDVQERAQDLLDRLETGIMIASIDAKTNWPKQAERAFVAATEAGNEQDKMIKKAEEFKTRLLNNRAGPVYSELEILFREYMQAQDTRDPDAADQTMKRIENIVLTQAKGSAGQRIHQAHSFRRTVLEDIQGDVKEFQAYLEEYHRSPRLLANRLWTETQLAIFNRPEVTRRQLPGVQKELRLQISPDPEEKRAREEAGFQAKEKEKGDFSDADLDSSLPSKLMTR